MSGHAGIDFCTLGMFIIDDIYPAPSEKNQKPHLSIPGGAGTYSALGARLLSPSPLASSVGWIVDCGTDFPPVLRRDIESWNTGVLLRPRDGLTTKGWNGYSADEHRDFKYLTPKIRLTEHDLTPALLASRSFHMVCSQSRCIDLVKGITARRAAANLGSQSPLFIYEPSPDCAIATELNSTLEAIQHIDVISPNHSELLMLFGRKEEVYEGTVNRRAIEECSQALLEAASSTNHRLAVVVRAGKDGCFVVSNDTMQASKWLPAYHLNGQSRVVDPTGGGNGFLGGFAVGMVRTNDLIEAAILGSVSASFCIEQVGIPVLSHDDAGHELWNSTNVLARLEDFRSRLG